MWWPWNTLRTVFAMLYFEVVCLNFKLKGNGFATANLNYLYDLINNASAIPETWFWIPGCFQGDLIEERKFTLNVSWTTPWVGSWPDITEKTCQWAECWPPLLCFPTHAELKKLSQLPLPCSPVPCQGFSAMRVASANLPSASLLLIIYFAIAIRKGS